nr:AAA family ATPase [Bradyrhizobium sp. 62]
MIENAVQRLDPSRPYGADNRREGTAVAIVAESGAGKTSAMRHYLKNNPFFPNYGNPDGGCPLITVGVKSPCNLRNLGMGTLRAAGYLARTEKRESEAWPMAAYQMQDQEILFVAYEEAQRIIQQANRTERGKVIETLAGLMTDTVWPLHLILSGLPRLKALFQDSFLEDAKPDSPERKAHITLKRRTRFVEFAPIDLKADRKDIDSGIEEYAKLGGVSLKLLKEGEMRARLSHAAAYQFGLFWDLTTLAIDACLRSGRKEVELDDYADGYATRTMEPVELNPFAVDHWNAIDTSIIQRHPEDQIDTKPRGKRSKPERRRGDD